MCGRLIVVLLALIALAQVLCLAAQRMDERLKWREPPTLPKACDCWPCCDCDDCRCSTGTD